jgi:hypothetical protein
MTHIDTGYQHSSNIQHGSGSEKGGEGFGVMQVKHDLQAEADRANGARKGQRSIASIHSEPAWRLDVDKNQLHGETFHQMHASIRSGQSWIRPSFSHVGVPSYYVHIVHCIACKTEESPIKVFYGDDRGCNAGGCA